MLVLIQYNLPTRKFGVPGRSYLLDRGLDGSFGVGNPGIAAKANLEEALESNERFRSGTYSYFIAFIRGDISTSRDSPRIVTKTIDFFGFRLRGNWPGNTLETMEVDAWVNQDGIYVKNRRVAWFHETEPILTAEGTYRKSTTDMSQYLDEPPNIIEGITIDSQQVIK